MSRVMMRRACLVGAFAAAGASAWWFRSRSATPLVFEPSSAELISGVREGLEARVGLRLVNRSHHPIRITSVWTSCACASVVTAGNEPLRRGVVVPPASAMPVEVTIATEGLSGTRRELIRVLGEADGRTVATEADCTVHVLAGLRSDPYELVLHDVGSEPVHATIKIGDGYEDPGVEVAELKCSHPALTATLERLEHPGDLPGGLKHRYNVHLTIQPDPNPGIQQYYLDVIPHGDANPLRIPMICQKKRPKRYLEPPVLVLRRNEVSQRVVRRVLVQTGGISADKLAVISKPQCVRVRLEQGDESVWLRVEWNAKDAAALRETASVVISTRGSAKYTWRLRLVPEPQRERGAE